jgi:transposase
MCDAKNMKPPIRIRTLTPDEQAALERGLHSPYAFTLRRCQILLASARGELAPAISQQLGCCDQAVREAIHAFHQEGLAALQAKSHAPHHVGTKLTDEQAQQIAQILHRSPREFGKASSLWTLDLLVEVSWSEHLVDQPVSDETIRQALLRLGIAWKRAKHWITSPDLAYERKKTDAIPCSS